MVGVRRNKVWIVSSVNVALSSSAKGNTAALSRIAQAAVFSCACVSLLAVDKAGRFISDDIIFSILNYQRLCNLMCRQTRSYLNLLSSLPFRSYLLHISVKKKDLPA